MKSETEIRTKLTHYEAMLAGFRAAHNTDHPEVFLGTEHILPGAGLEALRSSTEMDKAISNLPPEDQQGIKRVFEGYARHMAELMEDRISILKWILDEQG